MPNYIVTGWIGLWLYRRTYSARNLRILIPAGLLGVLIGWAVAARVSDALVGLLVGVDRHRLPPQRLDPPPQPDRGRGRRTCRAAVFWGTVAGFTSFVSHSGAPPFQMYVLPQKLEKLAFAGTATILFAIINLAKLIPYWALGSFSAIDPKLPLLILPVGILGTWVGAKLTRIMPDKLFFGFVQAALFLVSLKLVWDFF